MHSAATTQKNAKKNLRMSKKSSVAKIYSFPSVKGDSTFQIQLQVVSPEEQAEKRNPAYTYFRID